MRVCQYCAIYYDPKVAMAPKGYCSQEHARIGERPYSKVPLKPHDPDEDLRLFATKLLIQYHYDNHTNYFGPDCPLDLCLEARILGL